MQLKLSHSLNAHQRIYNIVPKRCFPTKLVYIHPYLYINQTILIAKKYDIISVVIPAGYI